MKSFTECFATYGAKLPNSQWAVSAIAADGALVLSCWNLYFSRPGKDTLRYSDRLSRWAGNEAGNRLLHSHLAKAYASNLPVRLVIATPSDRQVVHNGLDASGMKKTFHVRPDLVGMVVHFDGDEFAIDFSRKSQ